MAESGTVGRLLPWGDGVRFYRGKRSPNEVETSEEVDGGPHPESLWMVSRVVSVEEHYFSNEKDAREFAATGVWTVEAPQSQIKVAS